jgi:hypothetical protein
LGSFAKDLSLPPQELLKLFSPPDSLSVWIRTPWEFLARPFRPIIDHWEEWNRAVDPVAYLRRLLAQDAPGTLTSFLLALLQVAAVLVPLLTLR